MSSVQIAIINASTVLSDTQVADVVPALQQQVSKDYAPAWGTDATLIFVPKGQNPPVGAWWIAILDNSDTAGILGFHDESVEGLPLGKVFAGTDMQYNEPWSVTASHELLEMLGDPNINLMVMVDGKAHRHHVWAYENCDPVEDTQYSYKIDGVAVSNFCFPSWWQLFQTGRQGVQFDQQGLLHAPFSLLPGGYASVFNFTGGGWTQITAENAPKDHRQRAPIGSRRERRRTPREQWLRSTVGR